jgi:hypothetical protein
MFPAARQLRALHANAIAVLIIYALVLASVGPAEMLRLFRMALLLSLALQDR